MKINLNTKRSLSFSSPLYALLVAILFSVNCFGQTFSCKNCPDEDDFVNGKDVGKTVNARSFSPENYKSKVFYYEYITTSLKLDNTEFLYDGSPFPNSAEKYHFSSPKDLRSHAALPSRPRKPTILLIPGVTGNPQTTFADLANTIAYNLEQIGPKDPKTLITPTGPIYTTIDNYNPADPITINGQKILSALDLILEKIPCGPIVIVTHGKGAIDANFALYLAYQRRLPENFSKIDAKKLPYLFSVDNPRFVKEIDIAPPYEGSPLFETVALKEAVDKGVAPSLSPYLGSTNPFKIIQDEKKLFYDYIKLFDAKEYGKLVLDISLKLGEKAWEYYKYTPFESGVVESYIRSIEPPHIKDFVGTSQKGLFIRDKEGFNPKDPVTGKSKIYAMGGWLYGGLKYTTKKVPSAPTSSMFNPTFLEVQVLELDAINLKFSGSQQNAIKGLTDGPLFIYGSSLKVNHGKIGDCGRGGSDGIIPYTSVLKGAEFNVNIISGDISSNSNIENQCFSLPKEFQLDHFSLLKNGVTCGRIYYEIYNSPQFKNPAKYAQCNKPQTLTAFEQSTENPSITSVTNNAFISTTYSDFVDGNILNQFPEGFLPDLDLSDSNNGALTATLNSNGNLETTTNANSETFSAAVVFDAIFNSGDDRIELTNNGIFNSGSDVNLTLSLIRGMQNVISADVNAIIISKDFSIVRNVALTLTGKAYELKNLNLSPGKYYVYIDAESLTENFFRSISSSFTIDPTIGVASGDAQACDFAPVCYTCTPDAGVTSITADQNQVGSNLEITPQIKFTNFGDATITSCNFSYSVGDEIERHPLTKKWEGELEPQNELDEYFSLDQSISVPITTKRIIIYTNQPNEIEGDDRDKDNDGRRYDITCLLDAAAGVLDYTIDRDAFTIKSNVDFKNEGAIAITSCNFYYILNGAAAQKLGTWTGNLTHGAVSNKVTLNDIQLSTDDLGETMVYIYVSDLNGATNEDCKQLNNTFEAIHICNPDARLTNIEPGLSTTVIVGLPQDDYDLTPSVEFNNQGFSEITSIQVKIKVQQTSPENKVLSEQTKTFNNISVKSGSSFKLVGFDKVAAKPGSIRLQAAILKVNDVDDKCNQGNGISKIIDTETGKNLDAGIESVTITDGQTNIGNGLAQTTAISKLYPLVKVRNAGKNAITSVTLNFSAKNISTGKSIDFNNQTFNVAIASGSISGDLKFPEIKFTERGEYDLIAEVVKVNNSTDENSTNNIGTGSYKVKLDLGVTQLYHTPHPAGGPGSGGWKISSSVEITNFGQLPITSFSISASASCSSCGYSEKDFPNKLNPGQKITVNNTDIEVPSNSTVNFSVSIQKVNGATNDDNSQNNSINRSVKTGDPVSNGDKQDWELCDAIYTFPAPGMTENPFLPGHGPQGPSTIQTLQCKAIDYKPQAAGHIMAHPNQNTTSSDDKAMVITAAIDDFLSNDNSTYTLQAINQLIESYFDAEENQAPALEKTQLGIKNVAKNYVLDKEVFIYPNPSKGLLNVAFMLNSEQIVKIDVYNMLGELVLKQTATGNGYINQQLDLSELNNGVYVIKIDDAQNIITKKVTLSKN